MSAGAHHREQPAPAACGAPCELLPRIRAPQRPRPPDDERPPDHRGSRMSTTTAAATRAAAATARGPQAHPIHPDHTPTGQLSFVVFFLGVNSSSIWRQPELGDQVAFESIASLAI